MLVAGFPAGAFQTNCYLVAAGEGQECVVVDPGQDAAERVEEALRQYRLTPSAVIATHGHFDHVYSAATVANAHGIAVHIHPADRDLLFDPMKGLSERSSAMFGGDLRLPEPDEVADLDEPVLEIADLKFTVDHTPGHTPGSVILRFTTDEGGQVALTGDTLFAGSIGRTDLPGGDMAIMRRSLREKVLAMDDATVCLPGHGGTTTIGAERATNPYLLDVSR